MKTRLLMTMTAVFAASSLSVAPVVAEDGISVQVSDRQGVFAIQGGFTVPAEEAGAWRVLTDYDRFGAFIPSMRSNVVERVGGRPALVAQETTTSFLGFSKTNRVVLKVEEEPTRRLRFTDVSGQDFEIYRGTWHLTATGGGTRVRYEAEAKPKFMPPAIGPAIMTETVRGLLRDLRKEVLRRQPA